MLQPMGVRGTPADRWISNVGTSWNIKTCDIPTYRWIARRNPTSNVFTACQNGGRSRINGHCHIRNYTEVVFEILTAIFTACTKVHQSNASRKLFSYFDIENS